MASIILDCDLMRFPHSGLYHYCLNIGLAVNKQLEAAGKEPMKMYVPPAEKDAFGRGSHTIVEKKWHKIWKPFLHGCKVWHAPFQSGRVIPDKRKHPDTKVVLTIHDLNPLHEGKSPEEQRRSIAHTQSLIDRSDAIVCISEFTKGDVLKNCKVGNKPVYVIHNGTHRVASDTIPFQQPLVSRPFLFGMGYVNTKKNYHSLLPLLHHNPELELVVAGRLDEPDYITKMQQLASDMGVSDRLRLTGPVSESDKAWYLRNCLAFVHPSLAEGFGAPVVEAMIFGKPLFLSNRTSLPEIGGDVAFYFSSFDGEHMQQVFASGMQRYQSTDLSAALIKRALQFDWDKNAAQYIQVYQSLL
jgi:glycosyltransferase involved in cell wall biosynthesis